MIFKYFTIRENQSIKEALKAIEKNHKGIVLIENNKKQIIGVATDGDIRRKIIKGISIDRNIIECCNRNFIFADIESPREDLLKMFDNSLRIIPVLNKQMKLVDILSSENLPLPVEQDFFVQAVAPVRVSFGGGGSDLTHYFSNNDGAVINSTISLYSHALLIPSKDSSIEIYSRDLNKSIKSKSLDKMLIKKDQDFSLIFALLRTISPDFGFKLYLNSDFRMGSGLGGSAVICAAILGCFNEIRKDKWDKYELSELAYQAERIYLSIAGGWQDQYASVFGGFNFIEFKKSQNLIHSLKINKKDILELESNLFLVDVGGMHDSSNIHDDQKNEMQSELVNKLVNENVKLCYEIRDHLLRGRLNQFAKCLDQAWLLKRQFSKKISNKNIDNIYSSAKKNGALGGKLLGAGGGGYFLFYVPPINRHKFLNFVENCRNISLQKFKFEDEGLQSWTTRTSYK